MNWLKRKIQKLSGTEELKTKIEVLEKELATYKKESLESSKLYIEDYSLITKRLRYLEEEVFDCDESDINFEEE